MLNMHLNSPLKTIKLIKNIKKTNDLKPGMVIYDTYESAVITPDMEIISNLKRLN